MQQKHIDIHLRPIEALFISIILIGGMSTAIIYYEMIPHIPIMVALMLLIAYGLMKKVPAKELENGMVDEAKSGLGAVLIFFFIGMLISSWMMSGTIPTFVYGALQVVTGEFFFAIVFTVTAVIGMSIGSSLTTVATLGVAFISVSTALDLSLPITAGAIVSGVFFGDKMSPLSDTTNLASTVVNVDLFDHIRNMSWTTVPAFIISFIIFVFLSPTEAIAHFEKITLLKEGLLELNIVHWYSLIPFVILALLAILRVSAIITLSTGIISATIIGLIFNQSVTFKEALSILYFGYESTSGIEEIDALLSRGGMESMMFSISLVLLALSMGGLLFKLTILPVLLSSMKRLLINAPSLMCSAAASAIGINFLIGEQYLSILLTGNAFREHFKKAGLEAKNLSRILEDSGTVVNPLVPWSVCGIFITNILGVATVDYLPFAFFCLLSPILTLVFSITGLTISRKAAS
ncbi:Na+/H+ antiporter NhaC [Bacillus aquiflavi]|uniref:Na+/H+ antiporter NhaC n=1 Tax=Bacillus aquiflavi TaxID=2672567 RepID=UPI001CA9DF86|nr:Na+/H+ antiporter NhaC [Bacillus aquiflavi]UAC49174.1 Na+/H+ antiporter NhaC [Bacillus aquiflavi]